MMPTISPAVAEPMMVNDFFEDATSDDFEMDPTLVPPREVFQRDPFATDRT